MSNNFLITSQNYPAANESIPLTYAIWLLNDDVNHDDLLYWQDESTDGVFLAYSRSIEGAHRAVTELEKSLNAASGKYDERESLGKVQ